MEAKPIILLTRPREQNAGLQAELTRQGFATHIFPLLEIEAIPTEAIAKKCDLMIFTSQNAVRFYPAEIKAPVLAVGSGTQAALAKKNIHARIPVEFNSEGLLALPELQTVANKKIVIVTGENPRPLLAQVLRQRGADLEIICCYRRLKRRYAKAEIDKITERQNYWILVSSAESLANLIEIFGADLIWLHQQQLIVTSQSLSLQLPPLGFQLKPLVALNASDEAIVEMCLGSCRPL